MCSKVMLYTINTLKVCDIEMDITMATKEPQPRVEGVSLSGEMAQQGGSLYHGQRRSTSHRRILYDTEAHNLQRDSG